MTTRSRVAPFWSVTPAPRAVLPFVILTRATRSPVSNNTPRNEKVSLPTVAGTKKVPSEVLAAEKYWIDVVLVRSTSVKTAPNPLTVAGVLVPGTKNSTSRTLLPRAVNNRCGLNVEKVDEYVGSMLSNSIGATPALALTWKPVPGVEKTVPRGEFTLKKSAGKLLGAERASGTPSQLISRRMPPKDPLAPATVPPPRSTRNASRAEVMAAAFVPVADSTMTAPAEGCNITA